MILNNLPDYIYDSEFLTAEEVADYLSEVIKAPFIFDMGGAGVARDGITGLVGSKYADKPLIVAGHNDEDYIDILRPLAKKTFEKFATKHNIKLEEITRTRHNVCFRSMDNRAMTPHVDVGRVHKHWAFVLYLNNTDGDTIIFNQKYDGSTVLTEEDLTVYKKFSPSAGGALLFDGDFFHTWEYPVNSDFRAILNMNVVISTEQYF